MTITTEAVDYSDQLGLFNPRSITDVITVIGCGGIGATALPILVTLGFKRFVLWEDDVVEPRNIASQLLYRPEDLYKSKAEVTRDFLLAYGAEEVEIKGRFLTADDDVEGVVIGAVDSMAARKLIWESVKRSQPEFYLDGRIGGEHLTLFSVEPFDGEWYEKKWLFDDSEAAPLPCAERAVVYPSAMLGSFMASQLGKWSRGVSMPKRLEFNFTSLDFIKVGTIG